MEFVRCQFRYQQMDRLVLPSDFLSWSKKRVKIHSFPGAGSFRQANNSSKSWDIFAFYSTRRPVTVFMPRIHILSRINPVHDGFGGLVVSMLASSKTYGIVRNYD